jgi:ABC-type proline/glycine betaine transport system permease subunit
VYTIRTSKVVKALGKYCANISSYTFWLWVGRVVPQVALLITLLVLAIAPNAWHDWYLILIVGLVGTVICTFWWWLLYAVTNIYKNLREVKGQLLSVTKELSETKALIAIKTKDLKAEHLEGLGRRKTDKK